MPSLAAQARTLRDRVEGAARRAGREYADITIVAVTKTHAWEVVWDAFDEGFRHFGENYVQEASAKIAALAGQGMADEMRFHFIGRLQGNKVKSAVRLFHWIHTVDSEKLATALNNEAERQGKTPNVLVQINTGHEAQKAGIGPEDAPTLVRQIAGMRHLRLEGLMAIPPATENPEDVRPHFRTLRELRDEINRRGDTPSPINHLSMGMSHDFEIAIEEGATLIRVGTLLFGPRAN